MTCGIGNNLRVNHSIHIFYVHVTTQTRSAVGRAERYRTHLLPQLCPKAFNPNSIPGFPPQCTKYMLGCSHPLWDACGPLPLVLMIRCCTSPYHILDEICGVSGFRYTVRVKAFMSPSPGTCLVLPGLPCVRWSSNHSSGPKVPPVTEAMNTWYHHLTPP